MYYLIVHRTLNFSPETLNHITKPAFYIAPAFSPAIVARRKRRRRHVKHREVNDTKHSGKWPSRRWSDWSLGSCPIVVEWGERRMPRKARKTTSAPPKSRFTTQLIEPDNLTQCGSGNWVAGWWVSNPGQLANKRTNYVKWPGFKRNN